MDIVYTSQVCYTDEDMHKIRMLRELRRRTKTTNSLAYEQATRLEEALHDRAFERYEEAKHIPKAKLAAGVREAREPFCPPPDMSKATALDPPLPVAYSEALKAADDLFKGVGTAPLWTANPAPPLPAPVDHVPWAPNPPSLPPASDQPRKRAVRKMR